MSSYAWSRTDSGSESGAHSVAVLLPGAGYTAQAPLLCWCAEMLTELGWHVQAVEWTIHDSAGNDPRTFVEQAVAEAFDSAPRASRRLIVAKSFGTHALSWARRAGIPGVWLTPILTNDAVRQALLGASSADLAIGGEADELWLPEKVAGTDARLISVPEANHSLTIAGDWRRSLAIQNEIFIEIAGHLESM